MKRNLMLTVLFLLSVFFFYFLGDFSIKDAMIWTPVFAVAFLFMCFLVFKITKSRKFALGFEIVVLVVLVFLGGYRFFNDCLVTVPENCFFFDGDGNCLLLPQDDKQTFIVWECWNDPWSVSIVKRPEGLTPTQYGDLVRAAYEGYNKDGGSRFLGLIWNHEPGFADLSRD